MKKLILAFCTSFALLPIDSNAESIIKGRPTVSRPSSTTWYVKCDETNTDCIIFRNDGSAYIPDLDIHIGCVSAPTVNGDPLDIDVDYDDPEIKHVYFSDCN